jgi:hypothetical protein
MDRGIKNPKDSNVYRILHCGYYTTPSGSHIVVRNVFYKREIPPGLVGGNILESIEADIQKGLAELKELM